MKRNFIYSNEILNEVRKNLSAESYKYIYSPKFIFLCGKGFDYSNPKSYSETNRGIIQDYISAKDPNAYIVLSEKLWENGLLEEIDLLTFEEFLAEISDYVILFVESMGSACELGAFTFEDRSLMEKLVIVLNEKYKIGDSFIKHGPITKAIKFGTPVLYADLDGPLLSSKELIEQIDKIITSMKERTALNKRTINKSEQITLNSFIVEILEIIRLFQPINKDDLLYIYKKIKNIQPFRFVKKNGQPFNTKIQTSYVINLLINLNVLSLDAEKLSLNKQAPYDNFMFSFTPLTLSMARSKILSRKYKYKEI